MKSLEFVFAPAATIRYTTDGSNPKEYGVFTWGNNCAQNRTLAVAEAEGIYSDILQIKIDWKSNYGITIDKNKPLKLDKRCRTDDTRET